MSKRIIFYTVVATIILSIFLFIFISRKLERYEAVFLQEENSMSSDEKIGFYDSVKLNVGQINDDEFGQYIREISSSIKNKSFLEIGTWNGLGSTKQFVSELVKRNDEYAFYSLECNSEKSNIAKNFYKDVANVFILNEVIFKDEPENFYTIFPQCNSDEMYKQWNDIDMVNMKKCNLFLDRWNLPPIFDVILLDGGEFTTYFEYQFLKERCVLLLLDDINTDKCKLIVQEIENSPNEWEIIVKNTSSRNGFMSCRKIIQLYKTEDYISTDNFFYFSNSFPDSKIKYYKHDFLFIDGVWRGENVKSCIGVKSEIVIVGHSDATMTNDIALRIQKETGCKVIFTTNNGSRYSWVYGIPLGITNKSDETDLHPIYGNTQILVDCQNYNLPLVNKLYINFSVNTNVAKRQSAYDYFYNKSFVTVGNTDNTLEGRTNFLNDIRKHRFVLCPEGNGFDTHRLWETLYCNRIPIVLRNDVYYFCMYYDDIPICWVDNWYEITEEFLDREYERLKDKLKSYNPKLTIDYWLNKIISMIQYQTQGPTI